MKEEPAGYSHTGGAGHFRPLKRYGIEGNLEKAITFFLRNFIKCHKILLCLFVYSINLLAHTPHANPRLSSAVFPVNAFSAYSRYFLSP